MRAVTVHDIDSVQNVLAFGLVDILRLDEKKILSSTWTCKNVECNGECATELDRLSDIGARVNGTELLRLASGIFQVIDGDFVATRTGDERPWLIIRAIDGSEYVVVTDDNDFLSKVGERFLDVRESPEDAEYVA